MGIVITKAKLVEWKRKIVEASEGPWGYSYDDSTVVVVPTRDGRDNIICLQQYDAEFIAMAREAVPILLAEVERLRCWLRSTHRSLST